MGKLEKLKVIATHAASENWKGKYHSQKKYEDDIFDALLYGYELAKKKFKKKNNESSKRKIKKKSIMLADGNTTLRVSD